jgi:hypothetical protein
VSWEKETQIYCKQYPMLAVTCKRTIYRTVEQS